MKVLVAYMSQTGNTRRVAEAIYQEIKCEKEIKQVKEVKTLAGYDLAFLGFPVHAHGPDWQVRRFLAKQTGGQRIALFITHGAPDGVEEVAGYLARFRDAAAGATLIGVFDCQGQIARLPRLVMFISPNPKERRAAKDYSDRGQPDAMRLERARAFAGEIMLKINA